MRRLPNELLSEILKYVYDKVHDTGPLLNFSKTCQHFRSIAQPLIFRRFVIDCKYRNSDIDILLHHIPRLEFYSSDTIAPFVREFTLSDNILNLHPEFRKFTAEVFRELHRFLNVRSLSFSGVDFDQFALEQVAKLSSLGHLDVKDSTAHWDAFLPMISTPSFSCFGESDENGVARRELHLWLQLLDLERLQVLHIQLNEEFCFFLTEYGDPTPFSFPLLDSIILDVNLKTLPLLPTLLSKTPALCSLKISLSCVGTPQYVRVMEGLVPPTTCPVPYLEDYHGPHMLLPVIFGQAMGSPSTYLRRMFLESVDPAGDGLDSFMNSFQSCDALQLKAVTHIHMSMLHSVDLKSLAKIQDMFPVLQVFNFHTAEYRSRQAFANNVDLADLYAVPLPSTLASLSIQWISFRTDGVVPDLVAAKDNLIPRLPNLNRLWLCDLSTRAFLWTREASRAEECCTLHKARSQDDVWKMDELRNPQCAIFRSSCWRRRGM